MANDSARKQFVRESASQFMAIAESFHNAPDCIALVSALPYNQRVFVERALWSLRKRYPNADPYRAYIALLATLHNV